MSRKSSKTSHGRLHVPTRAKSDEARRLIVPQRQVVTTTTSQERQEPKSGPQPLLLLPPRVRTSSTASLGLTGFSFPAPLDHTRLLPAHASRPTANTARLALLLPAHNEELIIEATIKSAIAAGQPIEDIYVVNDGSKDDTRRIATRCLGKANVLNVKQGGKAIAVKKAIEKFQITSRYTWLHVADADSIFSPDYFRHYTKKLDPTKYAVAVGFVQSLRGNWISTYRALSYTYSQHVARRVQSRLGMISVFPGPITCFRTDIIDKLEFGNQSLTEDFDITLQVHRKRLGRIVFIPRAINYTQDPQTLSDFIKQNFRWQRGFFQGVRKHRIGTRLHRIDLSIGFAMLQTLLFLLQLLVLVPLIIVLTGNWWVIPVFIAADIILNGFIALASSVIAKRWTLIGALPYFYFLRWLEISIHLISFVEVMILHKYQGETTGWAVAGRRYKISASAMLDVAK